MLKNRKFFIFYFLLSSIYVCLHCYFLLWKWQGRVVYFLLHVLFCAHNLIFFPGRYLHCFILENYENLWILIKKKKCNIQAGNEIQLFFIFKLNCFMIYRIFYGINFILIKNVCCQTQLIKKLENQPFPQWPHLHIIQENPLMLGLGPYIYKTNNKNDFLSEDYHKYYINKYK
jgi:hypothetical protein